MGVLALWATPRTVSTAFERMMIERGDHLVLDEPWSRVYYLGPQRRSARYPLTFPESTYEAVEAGVLELGREQPVFVKDMAYHAAPGITDAALTSMRHTFLIRDPRAALASLHRQWPDFTDDEAGYRAQRHLFERVAELQGTPPAVIDSDVLRADPAGVVAEWCRRIGIEHRPESLTWSSGMRAEWPLWHDWYENAARSTGFAPLTDTPRPALEPAMERAVSAATAHFDALRGQAIG
ncbi:MAG: sulfotransferase family protein [Ilumatobacteraceae bacterium]|nr:sulfotransferase family protein [Ilumatobacteraceae bacterium]